MSMDESRLWSGVFVCVLAIGITAILLQLLIPEGTVFPTSVNAVIQNGYRLLSILLGVLAGVALGELFKIRSNQKSGRSLLNDLLEELRVNLSIVGKGTPLRKGFWTLGIRSGRAEYLSDSDRRDLWEIYSTITHFNEDLQHVHRTKVTEGQDSVQPEYQKELDRLNEKIRTETEAFLTRHKVSFDE